MKNWNQEHVGMIHYSSYWRKYSLVLSVDELDNKIVELDKFADINDSLPTVREHRTALASNDEFLTMSEYLWVIKL